MLAALVLLLGFALLIGWEIVSCSYRVTLRKKGSQPCSAAVVVHVYLLKYCGFRLAASAFSRLT